MLDEAGLKKTRADSISSSHASSTASSVQHCIHVSSQSMDIGDKINPSEGCGVFGKSDKNDI